MIPLLRKKRRGATQGGGGGWADVASPNAAFSFLPFTIQKNGRSFRPDPAWDISAQISRAGGNRYVSKTGNDTTGDGLSWGTAWKTIGKALTALGATANACIHVGAGYWGWSDGGFNNNTTAVNRSFIGYGTCIIDGYYAQTYSLSSGQTYTYESASTPTISAVLDYGASDSDGMPTRYTAKTSIAAVEAAAGSYWYDGTAHILYVHTLENNSPDADVRAQYGGNSFCKITGAGLSVYAENFTVAFCVVPVSAASTLYFNGVKTFHFIGANQHISLTSSAIGYFKSCIRKSQVTAGVSSQEDLLYASTATIVEIDCEGSYSGGATGTASNGTTNHVAGTNVVIGGEYHHTYGPPVGFVGSGYAWLLGTYSHHCLATSANYYSFQMDEAVCYLDSCRSDNSTKDILATQTVHVRDFIGAASNDGTVLTY